jgi:hypothetical protein
MKDKTRNKGSWRHSRRFSKAAGNNTGAVKAPGSRRACMSVARGQARLATEMLGKQRRL